MCQRPKEWESGSFLGETEIASGDPAGTERLEALEREAAGRGFGFIARRQGSLDYAVEEWLIVK
jgi:hypothetical protein